MVVREDMNSGLVRALSSRQPLANEDASTIGLGIVGESQISRCNFYFTQFAFFFKWPTQHPGSRFSANGNGRKNLFSTVHAHLIHGPAMQLKRKNNKHWMPIGVRFQSKHAKTHTVNKKSTR